MMSLEQSKYLDVILMLDMNLHYMELEKQLIQRMIKALAVKAELIPEQYWVCNRHGSTWYPRKDCIACSYSDHELFTKLLVEKAIKEKNEPNESM